jgi:subtilisin family serine protease
MKYSKLIYILLIAVSLQLFVAKYYQLGFKSEETMDLGSVANKSKPTRTTELGKAVPSEKKPEKEVEIILKDPALSQAWGLQMTDAQKAWRVSQGSRDIVVAVIDTGVDEHHPDLINNLWVNKGETGKDKNGHDKANNHIDDDGNGFIDDVHGWNFVDNNNDLTDKHGHGTHIAGIIGAEGGNGIGISGVSPKVSLMILRYYDPKSAESNNLINTVKAISYATKMGALIINYSGGGLSPSPDERAAIEEANRKGILFVAAAGNERSNSDEKKYYPADYGLPNIVSVTAIDKKKHVLPSSNWGQSTVQIAAPGNEIYSTLPNGQYGNMTGTSQATAFVTGVAALVMAHNSELSKASSVIKYLTQTGDVEEGLEGKTAFARRLNTYKALAIQDSDLTFNGVHAENLAQFKPHQFASDPAVHQAMVEQEEGPEGQITAFGKKIRNFLNPTTRPQL